MKGTLGPAGRGREGLLPQRERHVRSGEDACGGWHFDVCLTSCMPTVYRQRPKSTHMGNCTRSLGCAAPTRHADLRAASVEGIILARGGNGVVCRGWVVATSASVMVVDGTASRLETAAVALRALHGGCYKPTRFKGTETRCGLAGSKETHRWRGCRCGTLRQRWWSSPRCQSCSRSGRSTMPTCCAGTGNSTQERCNSWTIQQTGAIKPKWHSQQCV